jgi:Asp-tRNA(Asn)/Glu-tRNA(Gln) amidotransferase A subunit family amidase
MSGRIGIFPVDGMEIDPIVDAAFADTVDKARQLGFDVRPIPRLPRGLREIAKAALLVVELAAAVIHAAERARNPAGFSRGFRDMLGWAESQTQARRQSARALIAEAEADIRQAFAPYDAVLMPTTPCLEFAFGPDRPRNTADFTVLANIAGLAATAFPVGASSVQAVGGNEALCLSLAEHLSARS